MSIKQMGVFGRFTIILLTIQWQKNFSKLTTAAVVGSMFCACERGAIWSPVPESIEGKIEDDYNKWRCTCNAKSNCLLGSDNHSIWRISIVQS